MDMVIQYDLRALTVKRRRVRCADRSSLGPHSGPYSTTPVLFIREIRINPWLKNSDGDFIVSLFAGEVELEFADADEGGIFFGQIQVAGRSLFDNDRNAETQSE